MKLSDRKDNHIAICLDEDVEYTSQNANGFADLRFEHDALPEIDKSQIDLTTTLFGKKLSAPLFISAMTGGTEKAKEINTRLAKAAAQCQIAMALGSQRKMIEDANVASSYALKDVAPSLPLLIGNLGAVQLNYGVGLKQIQSLIKETQCDAFNFHLNPLQESIQPEGNTNFSNLLPKLRDVIPQIGVPVIFKEVGSGLSKATVLKLKTLPIQGLETAGGGGTSWAKIESLRTANEIQKTTGELFARWGLPTAESIVICREVCPELTVLASGGLRNGIEVAKSLSLGADAAGMALPFLKAAEKSVDAVIEAIEKIKEELRTVMFLTGSKNLIDLKNKRLTRASDLTAGDRE